MTDERAAELARLRAQVEAARAYVRDPFSPSPAEAWIAFVAAVAEGEPGERARAVLAAFRAIEED